MSGTQELQKVLDLFEQRIAAVESKVGVGAPPPPPASTGSSDAPQVTAFDAYCSKSLEPFVQACAALNAKEATECADHVTQAWAAMRGFIVAASVSKKPGNFPGDCMALIKPCQEAMQSASKAISRGDWELHQKTVSEGVQCLQWLITAPGPKDVVESYIGGTDFHANKIRVKYKKTEPKQIAFCDTFKKLMVRSRRPAVLRCLHAIDARRLQERSSWVVSISILRPFGPSRATATATTRAGRSDGVC